MNIKNINFNKLKNQNWLQLLYIPIISGGIFLFSANLNLPFEGDQIAKAAKIIFMATEKTFFHPLQGIYFYRDHVFSFFYILSSIFYSLLGGNVFASMNLQSILLGAVFLLSTSTIFSKIYKVQGWYTLLIFLSMPIVVETFSYGNEVACALTFLSLSLAVTTTSLHWRFPIAAALYCLAIFSRADYIFLIPFWSFWIVTYTGNGKNYIDFLKQVSNLIGLLGISCVLYWLIFLRSFELGLGGHIGQYSFNPKILLAFLSYPFCISIVLLGLAGNFLLFYEHRRKALVHILLLLPLIYYANILTSPKFIIALCFLYGIPAAIFLSRVNIKLKIVSILLITIWWFLSISPFGLKFADAKHWVLPASDGSIPTGAYFAFYNSARAGKTPDQLQLKDLLEAGKKVFNHIQKSPDNYLFSFDNFNERLFLYMLMSDSKQDFKDALNNFQPKRWTPDLLGKAKDSKHKILLIEKSYLQNSDFTKKYLKSGQVRNPIQDKSKSFLPDFIEIGDSIPAGYDTSLGNRILFASDYFNGDSPITGENFLAFKNSLCWLDRSILPSTTEKPLYSDNDYFAYSFAKDPHCQYLNSAYPAKYYDEKNLQKNLKGKEPLKVNFWEYTHH